VDIRENAGSKTHLRFSLVYFDQQNIQKSKFNKRRKWLTERVKAEAIKLISALTDDFTKKLISVSKCSKTH